MRRLVTQWAEINSGSHNLEGLVVMCSRLEEAFRPLGGEVRRVELLPEQSIDNRGNYAETALGQALSIRKRQAAPLRVFLGIHMDTVYGPQDPFKLVRQEGNLLRGPGVVDAKGGLVVILVALEALERSEVAARIGWEVLINPDEELGSPGSAPLFAEAARRSHLGLVFEPTFPDGAMVSERKGSGNFSVVVRGRAAHAGRDFDAGRSAVVAASEFAVRAHAINGTIPEATINTGRIDGGGAVNVVPDLAIVRLNVRIARREDEQPVQAALKQLAAEMAARHGVSAEVHGGFLSPPKVLDSATQALCDQIATCAVELEVPMTWRKSGGVSDGNKLAAAGLPVVDTMGPRGGGLHSPDEYLLLDSLPERAKLSALLLMKLAAGEIKWPPERSPS